MSNTYLLTWNPTRWDWESLAADALQSRLGDMVEMRWSCGNTKRIVVDDRVFLIRLRSEPRGIVAAGWARSAPVLDAHWEGARAEEGEQALYVDTDFECILDVVNELPLPLDELQRALPEFHWTPQASGHQIPSDIASQLEATWAAHVGRPPATLRDEVSALEGEIEVRLVRHRRREQYMRQAKIEAVVAAGRRLACEVTGCGFDFEAVYGPEARRLAIVHHLQPLGTLAAPRRTRLEDVAIVCANCHAFIHHGGGCRELVDLLPVRPS